ncbi:DNA primase [Mycoplasma zalophidermidis]|uniref:DNA primase n=1 Tax=Mycoplasma zalophidermidis TaxID=398174 RepID=UPI001C10B775|nr:DNA primase [Mycoplasma zalophidermidis]MBU4689840.1 DNA primase [Mycoplasma zalophidermidis]MCR8966710.1 DNA primase [Mycoplasma zalophidermidis]
MNTNFKQLQDEILSRYDIVEVINKYIALSKSGQSFVCLCPFHDDSNPSMHVSETKQLFKCFVCGIGGNLISFLMKFKKLTYPDTLKLLADEASINYDSHIFYQKPSKYSQSDLEVLDLLDKVNSFFKLEFTRLKNTTLNSFYNSRDLSNDLLRNFDIGFASKENFLEFFAGEIKQNPTLFAKAGLINPESLQPSFNNRVTFGIRNDDGKIVGFSARTLDKDVKPKYINSVESHLFQKSELLYNFYKAKDFLETKELIITEGFFDVIALHKAGIINAVALMGTALTHKHFKLLNNKTIIMFLDGDNAGQHATLKSLSYLLSKNIHAKVVKNKTRLDPDEILKKYGSEYLNNLINDSVDSLDYIYENGKNQFLLIAGGDNRLNNIQNFVSYFSKYIEYSESNVRDFYSEKIYNDFKYKIIFKGNLQESNEYSIPDDSYLNNSQIDTATFMNMYQVPDYVPDLPEDPYDINLIPHNGISSPVNIVKKHKLPTLSWIDRLFYLILDFPDLIKFYLEKNKEDQMNFNVFDDYKEQIQNILENGELTQSNKKWIEEMITNNGELKSEFEAVKQDFKNYLGDKEKLSMNFEMIYENALKENDDKYIAFVQDPKTSRLIASNPAMFEQMTQNMLRINRRKK